MHVLYSRSRDIPCTESAVQLLPSTHHSCIVEWPTRHQMCGIASLIRVLLSTPSCLPCWVGNTANLHTCHAIWAACRRLALGAAGIGKYQRGVQSCCLVYTIPAALLTCEDMNLFVSLSLQVGLCCECALRAARTGHNGS